MRTETLRENPAAAGRAPNPWSFVPVLYFLQAMPVALVQEVATIVYKDLGVGNEAITRWTSLVALPWSLQLLLGPIVDLNSTKRKWTLTGQALIAIALAIVPFALALPNAFAISLGVFFVTAIFSTLCNIASDGLYLMALPKDDQARFSGVLTTSSRLGTLFCKGLLVYAAGVLITQGASKTTAWIIAFLAAAGVYALGHLINRVSLPRPPQDRPAVAESPGESRRDVARTFLVLGLALSGYFAVSAAWKLAANGIALLAGPGALPGWRLGAGGKFLGFDFGLTGVQAEVLQLVVCVPLALAFLAAARRTLVGSPMGDAFASYFRQSGILAILAFLMFYRFGEAMVAKMSILFLKDPIAKGGLGLGNEQVGAIKGIVGVVGIVLGGLAGGWVVARLGLRRSFWPLAVCMHLPILLYLWAAWVLPPVGAVYGVDFVDQFGYGFGYAGYMIYQMRVAQRGNYRTTHYAMGVGIGALFIQVAGILSGILQANFGYRGFFLAAILFAIPGLLSLLFVPIDEPETAARVA